MVRSLMLFTHILGVLSLFMGLSVEWLALEWLGRAKDRAEALPWITVSAAVPRVIGGAMLVILLTGFRLGARIGVLGNAWLLATYAALLIMAIVGGPVAGPRVRALRRAAALSTERSLSALQAAATDAVLRASLRVRVAFGLAIVYLMIAKPDTTQSAVVLVVAAAAAAAMILGRRHAATALVHG